MTSKGELNEILKVAKYFRDNNANTLDIADTLENSANVIEKDLDRIEKYGRVINFLKTHPTHLAAILGFEDYETFKIYYSPEYTKDVDEEIFNLVKEVFG